MEEIQEEKPKVCTGPDCGKEQTEKKKCCKEDCDCENCECHKEESTCQNCNCN